MFKYAAIAALSAASYYAVMNPPTFLDHFLIYLDAPPNNVFLSENYAPVADESCFFDLKVDGKIPPEMNGKYISHFKLILSAIL